MKFEMKIAKSILFCSIIALTAFSLACSCTPSLKSTVKRYMAWVQSSKIDSLYSVSCSGEKDGTDFQIRCSSAIVDYEKNKRRGKLNFDSVGIALIKSLALGAGTFYEFKDFKIEGKKATVIFKANMAYEDIYYEGLPDGTVIYYMKKPWGTIKKFELKKGKRLKGLLLSTVELKWILKKNNNSPTGWCVLSVEPVEGSQKYEIINKKIRK